MQQSDDVISIQRAPHAVPIMESRAVLSEGQGFYPCVNKAQKTVGGSVTKCHVFNTKIAYFLSKS